MPPTTTDSRVGSIIGARYRLEARIAAGGMATVYLATDEVLGRRIAVKIMHPALATDDGFVERFRREARNAARLNHPNIVTVHDWGRDGENIFMVMEYVEGTSLRELLDRKGKLGLENVKHMVAGIAAALDHAHGQGIVHRDVKPENVLLTSDGTVKVVDFGVARALAEGSRLTTDTVFGTMHYIAPEQLQHGDADSRADVYALGVMTYEMLTGRPAFTGDTPAAVAAARLAQSVPSPGMSPRIDGAVARATALRPADRMSSAGELAAALGALDAPAHLRDTLEVHRPAPQPMPTTALPRRAPRRRPSGRRIAAVLSVLLFGGAGAAAYLLLAPRYATVPSVEGRSITQAEAALVASDLRPGPRREVFDDRPPGTVVSSLPAPGARVRQEREVTLVVSKGPEMIPVPALVGKSPEEAAALIAEAGFTEGSRTEDFDLRVPRGQVASQSPPEGTARRGSSIDLVVSKGPELVVVPDATGKTPEQAKALLEQAGFGFARADDYSDTIPSGQVARTEPAAGQKGAKGGAVRVIVSKGPKPFEMPNLIGMDIAAARTKAKALGLVIGNEYPVPGSGKPKGQVQGQNPPAGAEVRKGTRMDLYYSA